MHNTHNSLIMKMFSAGLISFFIASPASAQNCPPGYGVVKLEIVNHSLGNEYVLVRSVSAVLLDYNEPYSPEYLVKCKRIEDSRASYKCGNLNVGYYSPGGGMVSIKPADPSLNSIKFEGGVGPYFLAQHNLPKDFQDKRIKKWCDMDESSGSATCYEESRVTNIHLPVQAGIRKKIFTEQFNRKITKCRMISF